jgi:uncharacterized cupin superfamily protein
LDDYCVFTAELPAGMIVPLHSHADRETFYVLAGEMSFYNGTSWQLLKKGASIDVLNNARHAWHNTSQSTASLLVVTTVRVGKFLQRISDSIETTLDTQDASKQKEHFFKLVEEHGYWLGSPEDNKDIGLPTDWHRTLDQ